MQKQKSLMPVMMSILVVLVFLIFLNNYFKISGYDTYGSSGAGTYSASESVLQSANGYTKELSNHGTVTFKVHGSSHSMRLEQVTKTSATVSVASDPVNITLDIGDEAKLNLTSADYYDVSVKLVDITYSRAKFTLKQINETIPVITPEAPLIVTAEEEENGTKETGTPEASATTKNFWTQPATLWTLGIVAAIIIILIVIIANAGKKVSKISRIRRRK